ncbi:MAG: GyrI-like domain-containing protein [Cytophagales bacterium]
METKNVKAKTALVFKTKAKFDKVPDIAMSHLPKMYETLEKLGLEEKEPTHFIYRGASGDMDKEFDLEIALVTNKSENINGPYHFKSIDPMKCISTPYKGDMKGLDKKYHEIFADLEKAQYKPSDEIREVYHNWAGENSSDNEIEIQVGLN